MAFVWLESGKVGCVWPVAATAAQRALSPHFQPIRREENVRGKFECKKKIQASIFSSKSKDNLLKVIMKKDSFFLKIFFNVYLLIF